MARDALFRAATNTAFFPALFIATGIAVLHIGPKLHLPVFIVVIKLANRADFLRTLWQVLATLLALAIAVILFAFQAITTRQGTNLREFVQDSLLLPLFHLGLTALMVIGLVLVEAGRAEPGVWPTTWALEVGGISILSLPMILIMAINSLDPEVQHRRRLRRIRFLARRSVRSEVIERLAYQILDRESARIGLHFAPIAFRQPAAGLTIVRARKAGRVTDMNLCLLERLANEIHALNLHLVVRLGAQVSAESPVVWLPSDTTLRNVRRAGRIVRVGRR